MLGGGFEPDSPLPGTPAGGETTCIFNELPSSIGAETHMYRAVLFVWISFAFRIAAQDRFPPELVHFKASDRPVFTGVPGQWDAKIRERGWILREGGEFKLWYTGYDGTKEGIRRLGYATSKDGVTWTRHPKNPLLPDLWVEDMTVVPHAGQYYMFAEGKNDVAHLLTSKNGIDWQPQGPLDVRKKDGTPITKGPYGTPTVLFDKGQWHLFYERSDLGVWLATSKDLKIWTHVQDEPVLKPGPAEYDRDLIALNQVVPYRGRYYAYYHGCADSGPNKRLWSTAVAVSKDLIHWEKFAGNPLFPVAANQSSGILVPMDKGFRMYTMHPEIVLHEGLAATR